VGNGNHRRPPLKKRRGSPVTRGLKVVQQPIDVSLRRVRGAGTLAGSTDSGEQGEPSRNRSRFRLKWREGEPVLERSEKTGETARQVRLRTPFCAALAVPCPCSIPKQNPNGRRPIVVSPGARREMNRRFTNACTRQPERSGGAAVETAFCNFYTYL